MQKFSSSGDIKCFIVYDLPSGQSIVSTNPLAAILDYTVFGFIMAYLTLIGTLELAIAGHAAVLIPVF